jgi:hypothetical protein
MSEIYDTKRVKGMGKTELIAAEAEVVKFAKKIKDILIFIEDTKVELAKNDNALGVAEKIKLYAERKLSNATREYDEIETLYWKTEKTLNDAHAKYEELISDHEYYIGLCDDLA